MELVDLRAGVRGDLLGALPGVLRRLGEELVVVDFGSTPRSRKKSRAFGTPLDIVLYADARSGARPTTVARHAIRSETMRRRTEPVTTMVLSAWRMRKTSTT
jgi:hypothetical protein